MAGDNHVSANRTRRPPYTGAALLLALLLAGGGIAHGDEPVVTTLADYEDDSVAVHITDVDNVLAADCDVGLAAIPARGQRSLMVEIGATERNASVGFDLCFRLGTLFDSAARVATRVWIKQGSVDVRFRVRDAAEQVFETRPITLEARNRWVRLAADLSPNNLTLLGQRAAADGSADTKPTWPIQIQGYCVRAHGIGRQTVYLDDLEVEHRASGPRMLRGEFKLDNPTHIYEPGALVRAAVVLENISRQRALPLNVQLAWLHSDGTELTAAQESINLPASGGDFRSSQPVDFSKRIVEPGLYRLVAQVRGPAWAVPAVFETTIAVTPTNRSLPRGRETFFGVQTNLLREPLGDQLLEIEIAREVGVQLLALEIPWREIEARPASYDFAALDTLINVITQRDIAIMLVVTEPPEWLPETAADWWERQADLLEALAGRYGKRVHAYQPLSPRQAGSGQLGSTDLAAIERIRARLAQVRPRVEVIAPSFLVAGPDTGDPSPSASSPDAKVQLAFQTAGDSVAALADLKTFAAQHELNWTRGHRWFHRAEALTGPGSSYDAVAVLRHYVQAARAGVAGVVWFDLRDDTNDPSHPELMRGLVRRDFSPKTPLLGLATAIGQLAGLVYAGELPGAASEFESALFIGGPRQVAVLFPKPNRILPAVLAPYSLVAGELSVFDFDRRQRQLLYTAATPLLPVLRRPFFLVLGAQRAQSQPQLLLARPWVRVPHTVYCARETTFQIEIVAPTDLHRSYIQIILPSEAPLRSSFSSRALRGNAGDSLPFAVTLTRTGDEGLEPTLLTVRIRLEGTSLETPVVVRPLFEIRPLKSPATIADPAFAIGQLKPSDPAAEDAATMDLHAGYQERSLDVAIGLPARLTADATLQLGLALENADTHAEVRIERLTQQPELRPDHGTERAQVRGWRCRLLDGQAGADSLCHIEIPARSLGLSAFEPGTRLLLAVRCHTLEPYNGSTPLDVGWGSGLDGARSTTDYQCTQLVELP